MRAVIGNTVESLAQLELINALERLGIAHLFVEDINRILNRINACRDKLFENNLYATALAFRILRQHGFQVSQGNSTPFIKHFSVMTKTNCGLVMTDVFKAYMDETGKFSESLCQDVEGLLCLYEATHLVAGGENILDDAMSFTTKHLKDHLRRNLEPNLAAQVSRSLEIPFHWRMLRSEARWYMDVYEKEKNMNPVLLQLAKVDFNLVQATLQRDLANMSRHEL